MRPIAIHRRATGVSGPTVHIPAGTYENTVIDPANANCTIDFRSDGSVAVSAGTNPSSPADWLGVGGVASDYDISFDSGGSWANLGVNQTKTVSRSVAGTTSTTFPTRIRRVVGGAILASGNITLQAIVEI